MAALRLLPLPPLIRIVSVSVRPSSGGPAPPASPVPPWLVSTPVPRGYWQGPGVLEEWLEWRARQGVKVRRYSDWLVVPPLNREQGGRPPPTPLREALRATWPAYPWPTPPSSPRAALEGVAVRKGVRRFSDWAPLTALELEAATGGLLKDHGRSPWRLLLTAYPEHPWRPWGVRWAPRGWARVPLHQRQLIAYLERTQDLDPALPGHWRRISHHLLRRLRLAHALDQAGGLSAVLAPWRPQVPPQLPPPSPSARSQRSGQRQLLLALSSLSPEAPLEEVALGPWRLDALLPGLRVGLELQGRQHYAALPQAGWGREGQQAQDEAKAALCRQEGIALVTVPYWWDGSTPTLAATLRAHLGDHHPLIRGWGLTGG